MNSVKKMWMQLFFTRLFVSERKQIAFMADEKSPVRNYHRFFAISCSEMRIKMLELKNINKYYNPGTVNQMCLFKDFNFLWKYSSRQR